MGKNTSSDLMCMYACTRDENNFENMQKLIQYAFNQLYGHASKL